MTGKTPISEADFRAEVRAFLEANAVRLRRQSLQWGVGSDAVTISYEKNPEDGARALAELKAWRQKRFDAGLGWIAGPVEYGGRGLPHEYDSIYREMEAEYDVPDDSLLAAGVSIFAPTILACGPEPMKQKYLRAIYRADIMACQLFSEPGAGSDLGGMRTRAVLDGDEWVVNGQKVWTSNAHLSDIAELFARTSTPESRHRGLTVFLVDMHAPGVTVRPIRQMTGGSSFNEVFLDNVRVPDANRVSEVNDGWRVVLDSLVHERSSVGTGTANRDLGPIVERLRQLIERMGRGDDALIRQRFAQLIMDVTALRHTTRRYADELARGADIGSKVALTKLMLSDCLTAIGDLAAAVLGHRMAADTGEWGTYAWSEVLLDAPSHHIGGGTDEILRNTLAEHALGLPRDRR